MFLNRSEEEGEDEVDSDFSIEENDEPVSDQDDDEPKKKRRIITKAYKVYWKTNNMYTSLDLLKFSHYVCHSCNINTACRLQFTWIPGVE